MNRIIKILIVIAIIVALAVGGYVLFRSVFEQREFMDVVTEVGGQAAGFSNQATDYVKSNIPMVTTYAGTATAAIGGALVIKKSAENKIASVTKVANTQIDGLVSEKNKLVESVESQKTKLISITTELGQTKILATDAQSKLMALERERDNWKLQFQTLDDKITTQGIPPKPTDKRVIEGNTLVVA